MSGKWSWHTGSLRYDDLCPTCNKPLRTQQVVQWADGKKYHVGCLLDNLVADYKEPVFDTEAYLSGNWGVLPRLPPGHVSKKP